jgi:hypothetical protein
MERTLAPHAPSYVRSISQPYGRRHPAAQYAPRFLAEPMGEEVARNGPRVRREGYVYNAYDRAVDVNGLLFHDSHAIKQHCTRGWWIWIPAVPVMRESSSGIQGYAINSSETRAVVATFCAQAPTISRADHVSLSRYFLANKTSPTDHLKFFAGALSVRWGPAHPPHRIAWSMSHRLHYSVFASLIGARPHETMSAHTHVLV